MSDRHAWVDYAKALGIVLVVSGHVARGMKGAGLLDGQAWFPVFDAVVYSFHMPLFFFLSGLFLLGSLKKRGGIGLVVNKVDTILYPYVVWSLLQGGVEVVLSAYTNGDTTARDVLAFAWAPRAQFWFLYALFLIFVLAVFIYRQVSVKGLGLLAFLVLYLLQAELQFPKIAEYVLRNGVYFALGVWFWERAARAEAQTRWLAPFLVDLFLGAQYWFHVALDGQNAEQGVSALLLALVSIAAVVTVSMCLSALRMRWVSAIGSASMALFLMHILAGSGSRVFMLEVLHSQSPSMHLLIGTFVGIALPIVVLQVMKRFNWMFLLEVPPMLSLQHWVRQRSEASRKECQIAGAEK